MSDINTVFDEPQSDYLELFNKFETNLKFKNNSIEEWSAILKIKQLNEDFSLADLERYTLKISNLTDIIVENYSLAYANYTGLKKSVEKNMMLAKQEVLDEIDNHNKVTVSNVDKKKKPSNDQLEMMAYNKIQKLQINFAISEIFYNFWKLQYDKIYLLNQRVTSLNVLKNIESKGVNLT